MSKKIYVEQSALLEALQAAINKQAGKPDALQFISDILDAPFVPPPADVVPVVRGEWIYSATYAFNGKAVQAFKCSECGCKMLEADEVAHFCPNCGADMRGEA